MQNEVCIVQYLIHPELRCIAEAAMNLHASIEVPEPKVARSTTEYFVYSLASSQGTITRRIH